MIVTHIQHWSISPKSANNLNVIYYKEKIAHMEQLALAKAPLLNA